MPKRRLPLVTGSYRDSNRHWSRQECIGWMPVRAEQPGTLTEWQLRQLPGCKPFVYVGTSVAGESGPEFTPAGVNRGLRNVEGKLFVVSGNQLYQISNAGVAIPRGTIPGVGRVSMAHNANGLGNELLVVNGFAGYVWNTQTQAFGKVTDTGYPGAFIADFVDQYLAQVEPSGRYWFHSDLADAHSYNTLDQYVAEGDPDRIVSLIVSHREVLVLGKKTIEPYVNTGGGTGTFERASNTVIEVGCSARYSVKRMDGSPFWLDDQRLVRRLDGYTPVILSTDPVAQAFAECTEAEIAQAYAFTWEPAGHKVYYITVPGRFTFGYDAKTGQWHRRKTYGLNHWAVVDVVSWNGKWIAADSRSSKLYELADAYPLDECDPLERELTAPTVWADQNPITLDEIELLLGDSSVSSGPASFTDQPVGPSISGAAPDGDVLEAYPGYSYVIVEGDAPISVAKILSGSVPSGLAFSGGSIEPGTPTQAGVFQFVVEVVDANGLYARLGDTVAILAELHSVGSFEPSPPSDDLLVSIPDDVGLGDLLLMQVVAGAVYEHPTITVPVGWNLMGAATFAYPTPAGNKFTYQWYWKIAGADEDESFTVSAQGAEFDVQANVAQVWKIESHLHNVDSPPEVVFSEMQSGYVITSPSITPSWSGSSIVIAALGGSYGPVSTKPDEFPYEDGQQNVPSGPETVGNYIPFCSGCYDFMPPGIVASADFGRGENTGGIVASHVLVRMAN